MNSPNEILSKVDRSNNKRCTIEKTISALRNEHFFQIIVPDVSEWSEVRRRRIMNAHYLMERLMITHYSRCCLMYKVINVCISCALMLLK